MSAFSHLHSQKKTQNRKKKNMGLLVAQLETEISGGGETEISGGEPSYCPAEVMPAAPITHNCHFTRDPVIPLNH